MKLAVKLQSKQSLVKGLILASLVVAASFTSQAAVASLLFPNIQSGDGPIIFKSTGITPGGVDLPLDSATVYVGLSKSSPCSDLAGVLVEGEGHVRAENGTDSETSEDFINSEALLNAPYNKPGSVTCFRIDTVYKGKIYSTGNIQLIWDGKQYTKANPSAITVDYTK